MPEPRSYDDPCGIARALDRVGERWALLVIRELVLGPKRFTDLRAGLPNASPNVLSQRLRELEASGVVERRRLPPPASATVYALTPWGEELRPVLFALGRWGSQAPAPAGELSTDALLVALETMFDGSGDARIDLRLGDERFQVVVAEGRLAIARGPCDGWDAAITTDVAGLRRAVFRGQPEGLRVEGDEAVVVRFLTGFRPPG